MLYLYLIITINIIPVINLLADIFCREVVSKRRWIFLLFSYDVLMYELVWCILL